MNEKDIRKLLGDVADGAVSIDDALNDLRRLPVKDLGDARIDTHRDLRTGYPEVIFCQGKTVSQVVSIAEFMIESGRTLLGTRATSEMYDAVRQIDARVEYDELARTLVLRQHEPDVPDSYIAVVTAGTSDLPVAREALVTAEVLGNRVELVSDVGVAGIHRLLGSLDVITGARVVVVAAGMEGALPSVVGGLVEKPVIAVPTSVGYGASFNGLAALLGMLNSCASGVSVVNIDNGFGAGYLASIINHL